MFFNFSLPIWELWTYEAIVTSSVFDEFSATFEDTGCQFLSTWGGVGSNPDDRETSNVNFSIL